jgi:translocation and assembly module TamA
VNVAFDLGPQFRIGKATIAGNVPQDVASQLDLQPGAPATATSVLADQTRLLNALRGAGYALAKVDLPPATLRPDQNVLDVTFQVSSGPQVDIGPIAITGLRDMHEDFVRRRMLLHQGERFSPDAIEKARQDLASLGVFSVVRGTGGSGRCQRPASGHLRRHRAAAALGRGRALTHRPGINVNAGWRHRNLSATRSNSISPAPSSSAATRSRSPAIRWVQFIKPDWQRDQSLEFDLGAVKQSLRAYDQRPLRRRRRSTASCRCTGRSASASPASRSASHSKASRGANHRSAARREIRQH